MTQKRKGHSQVHQNSFAFKHNPASKKTQKILSTPISRLLCPKCFQLIEWKKQYRKYKPLTVPRKCNLCEQKTVTKAYHAICDKCARETKQCPKCRKEFETNEEDLNDAEMQQAAKDIAVMSLRDRKKLVRKLKKEEEEEEEAEDENEDDEDNEDGEENEDDEADDDDFEDVEEDEDVEDLKQLKKSKDLNKIAKDDPFAKILKQQKQKEANIKKLQQEQQQQKSRSNSNNNDDLLSQLEQEVAQLSK